MAIEYDPSENPTTGIPFSNGEEEAGLINKKSEGGAYTNESVGEYATARSAANDAKESAANAAESEANAASDAIASAASASAASTSAVNALTSESNSLVSANNSQNSAVASAESAAESLASQVASETAKSLAVLAQGAAEFAETNSAASALAASTSEANAAASESAAATSATNASTSESNALASATASSLSASQSAASAAASLVSENNAASYATNSAISATASQTAQTAAELAQSLAESAKTATENIFDQFGDQYLGSHATDPATDNDGDPLTDGDIYWNTTDSVLKFYTGTEWTAPEDVATTAASNASTSATNAATSATNAGISATNAANSATASATSATNASVSEVNAATSATNASISETNAGVSETNAAASAGNAATSATNASISETNAGVSAANAANSATAASTSETNAGISATSASTSATSASNSASAASVSETNAGVSATNAANSATAASGSAAAAATSASSASDSATAASVSETNAEVSATAAANSATSSAISATASATSAIASATSATEAATSETNAETIQTNLYSIYLGTQTSDPTVDLNGNTVSAGAWYYNTTLNVTRIYNGTEWVNGAVDTSSFVLTDGDGTLNSLQFNGGTGDQGTLSWNPEDETLDLVVSPDVTYQLGQELGVVARNLSGVTLSNGAVVRVTGASGNKITIDLADSSTELNSSSTYAIVTEVIGNNSTGKVTTNGLVRGLDTSAFAEGAAVWLGNNGTFTTTKPSSPDHLVHIGWVVRSHAHEGSILVRISNGWEIDELHDVLITDLSDNELLQWNAAASVWENRTISEAGLATSAQGSKADTAFSWGDHNAANYYSASGGTISGSVTTTGDVVIGGNLTVDGTTTTVNAENLSITDNMIYLNDGNTTLNEDLGWSGNYNDGTYAHAGFFRDASDGRFKAFDGYTPEVGTTVDTTHASFSLADIQAGNFYGNLVGNAATASTADKWDSARTITLDGDLSGSVSIDGTSNVVLSANINANAVTLGTDTSGDYAGAVIAGAGIAITGTPGEGTTYTVSHEDTSAQASVTNSGNTFIQSIGLDTYGHITSVDSVTVNIPAGYNGWTISDGTNSENVIDGSTVNVVGSGATSTSYNPTTNTLTITSTDTDTVYTHPSYNGDDFSVDTGPLTGATVVSDIDINVTTDTLGHVVDANGVVSTRTLTLGDLGYTGASDANKYVHPTHPGDDINLDTGPLSGATVISDLDFNVTTDTQGHVTDANATYATRNITAADVGAAPASHTHNYISEGGTSFSGTYPVAVRVSANNFYSDADITFTGSTSILNTTGGYTVGGTNTVFHDGYHPNADQWTTARTLSLSGDASGSVSWDGSANATLSVTVNNDSHSHSNYVQQLGISSTPNYLTASSRRVDPNADNPTNEHYAVMTYGNQGNVTGQLATHFVTGATYNRAYNSSWSAWSRMFDDDYHPNADKWTTARTLTLTGDVTGSVSWDGSGNVSMTTAVANDSHNHDHSDGNFTVNGALYVAPTATSSNIYMGDTDHGSRRIHNNSNQIGFLDSANGWGCYADDAGNWYSTDSVRAPIFYDSNDTNYYLDPANSGTAMKLRGKIILEQGNTTVGGIELNSVKDSTWPFEFTTNDVGNDNPSGFWVGSNGYPDMRLRREDGTVRALISSWERSYTNFGFTDTQDIRSPIFYDNNNTSYYVDPASTSNIVAMRMKGNLSFDNYGLGVIGYYTSTRLQNVFAMDDQYKISDDGTSVGNHYGIVWSHSNAGTLGGANNLAGHGMILLTAGAYDGSWGEGKLDTPGSIYSPIYYDRNNTGYYANPASTSVFNDFRCDIMYDKDNTSYYVRPGSTTILNDARANIWYSRSNTGYYSDPESTSRLNVVNANSYLQNGSPLEAGAKEGLFWENDTTVTSNYTITSGKNAMSAGPITIATGVTVTIPTGSAWTIV